MKVLQEYNTTLDEQWSDENRDKLDDAKSEAASQRGSRLREDRPTQRANGNGNPSHNGDGTPNTIEADERFTDMANVGELIEQFGDTFRHHHKRGVYLVKNEREGRWIEDNTGHAAQCAKTIGRAQWDRVPDAKFRKDAIRHATRSESAQGIAAMLALAHSEPGIGVTAAMMDADPWAHEHTERSFGSSHRRASPALAGGLDDQTLPGRFRPGRTMSAVRCVHGSHHGRQLDDDRLSPSRARNVFDWRHKRSKSFGCSTGKVRTVRAFCWIHSPG